MTPIIVEPHGGRWAVKTSPDAMPVSEYETRAAAESAARAMDAGPVEVRDEDPSGVPATPPAAESPYVDGEHPEGRGSRGIPSTERPRENQAGM